MDVLIVYDSKTGNTEKMALSVKEGVEKAGLEADLRHVKDASIDELLKYKGIILGTPVYYGLPSGGMKEFIDDSVKYHGKLEDRIGGAFASSGGTHSGAETAILSLLEALMIHGMVIQGTSERNHYGPASVGAPDDNDREACRRLGIRVSELVKKIH
ncbi:MAG: flavodoxin family protein [Candidatus Bathyarchaeia archaeon]